ncbi:MAG: hypothetical protein HZR80_05050 [Candidatus Heimdallarchaeota archaeon]
MMSQKGLAVVCRTAEGKELYTVLTSGIYHEVNPLTIKRMLDITKQKMVGSVTWVVFCPIAKKCTFEDEGRTCKFPLKWLTKDINETIYAILDDFGSVEALQKNAGNPFITTQYVLTILFAHEY